MPQSFPWFTVIFLLALGAWSAGAPPADDVTLLAARRLAG